jgi:hypothetical protein
METFLTFMTILTSSVMISLMNIMSAKWLSEEIELSKSKIVRIILVIPPIAIISSLIFALLVSIGMVIIKVIEFIK